MVCMVVGMHGSKKDQIKDTESIYIFLTKNRYPVKGLFYKVGKIGEQYQGGGVRTIGLRQGRMS